MKILISILAVIIIVLGIGYLLLTKTTYLDFIKNWPIPGIKLCCIKDDTLEKTEVTPPSYVPDVSTQPATQQKYFQDKDLMLVSQVTVVSIKSKDGTPIINLPNALSFKIKIDKDLFVSKGFSEADKKKVQMYFWDNMLIQYELIGGVLNTADDNVEVKINKTGTYVLGIRK